MKREEFENAGFAFNLSTENTQNDNVIVISLPEFSSNLKSKIAGDFCVFLKVLRRTVNGKHLMHL